MRIKLTHEEKLLRRRERYALTASKRNKLDREKYAIAVESGLTPTEARRVRGFGKETIVKKYPKISYSKQTKVYYITPKVKPKKEDLVRVDKPEKLSRTEKRRKARELGYTPAEADYLRDISENKWLDIINNNIIIDSSGRENRWAMMASRESYDQSIIDECEAINIEAGYDINSRYGWSVYYFWYIYGGEIDDWKEFCMPDTFITDMLDYKGNASTYLLRSGIKANPKAKTYEKTLKKKTKYKKQPQKKRYGQVRSYKNMLKNKKKEPYVRNKSKVS